jgi:peroxisomal 2,4-dienoyl-CoA reductase
MSIFTKDLLKGKVAFITGGGTGICKGITEAFAEHGCETVITSRKAEHLEPTAAEITAKTGKQCLAVVADVRYPEQVEAAVAKAIETLGRIDILINGAAGNFLCPAAEMSYNAFSTVIDIDTKGTWNVSRAVFKGWMQEHGGHILNISATLHYGGTPMQLHVSAAKAAIDAMTRNLAVEWGPAGVRVNGIAPGAVGDTEGAQRLFPGEIAEKISKMTPIRRIGRIADVANLALFLCSDAASNINGHTVITDGGQHLLGSALGRMM